MTKEKALYQTKLIIESLSEEEYNLIPNNFIEYINSNYEYDENISINPELSLEEQQIAPETYSILNEMLGTMDKQKIELVSEKIKVTEEYEDLKDENIELKSLIESLKKENDKIFQVKDLVVDYKNELQKRMNEIENLKKQNQELYSSIKKAPWIIRKLFFKDFEIKLLKQ